MGRLSEVVFVLSFFFLSTGASGALNGTSSGPATESMQDTVYSRQLLYNGRIWENRYQNILSHEFFMTRNPVNGALTINGMSFKNVLLRYDLFNDELLILDSPDSYLQLNKEAVGSFILDIDGYIYLFENFDSKNPAGPKGYGQVLYHGETYLIKKHIKEIRKNAVDNMYDSFSEAQSTWLIKGEGSFRLSGRKDLYRALSDRGAEVKNFVRSSGIRFSLKEPESVIPILEFYDSLKDRSGE